MIDFVIKPAKATPYKLTVGSRDIYVWEKIGAGRSFSSLGEGLTMVSAYELAHVAAKNAGKFTGSLDEFVESNELDFEVNDEAADPTSPAP